MADNGSSSWRPGSRDHGRQDRFRSATTSSPKTRTGPRPQGGGRRRCCARRCTRSAAPPGQALRREPVGRPADLPGDGRRRERTARSSTCLSGIDPQGCEVSSFKAPSSEELDHDFLWRTTRAPARAGAHRRVQSLVLRGSAHRPRPPASCSSSAAAAAPLVTQRSGASDSRTSTRSSSIMARNGYLDPQVLPPRLEGRAARGDS